MTSRSFESRRVGLPALPTVGKGRARRPILRLSQRGYTFTEILIVTAIIGILVALLLPAVQAAREAARRMNCTKNLEQLIIAVQNYEMLHRVYPPGTVNQTGPIQSLPNGYHHNWLIQILPFIEQKNTYAHVDDLVGVYHANNVPVRTLDIAGFRCPSSPASGTGYTDYAGVHHDIEAPIDVTNNGTFFLNSRISYFDLKDGSSNTLFLGEKNTYAGDLGWMSGTRATLRNTGIRINASRWRNLQGRRYSNWTSRYPPGIPDARFETDEIPSDEDLLASLIGNGIGIDSSLNEWTASDPQLAVTEGTADEYGYYEEPAFDSSDDPIIPVARPTDASLAVGGFGSQHPGGAQFAAGDGSVRFYSETVDSDTLLQLGHRADGRLTGGDW